MSEVDASCPLAKQYRLLELLIAFYDRAADAVGKHVYLSEILAMSEREELLRLRDVPANEFDEVSRVLSERMEASFRAAIAGVKTQ